MTPKLVENLSTLADLARELSDVSWISVDLEAAGFHRFSDRVCLLQISTQSCTYLVDTLVVDAGDALRPVLEDPDVRVFMHGADFDMRLFDRDLDIHPHGLFDTQIAATLAGEPAVGLAALLQTYLGVTLSKKFQRADWAQRPLPDGMIAYAADDTQHLETLAGILTSRLEELGRLSWAQTDFRLMEEIRWTHDTADPVTRVKGAQYLEPLQVALLRECLAWRSAIAERRDRALFRVTADSVLLAIAKDDVSTLNGLQALKGMNERLAAQDGPALLSRLAEIRRRPGDEVRGYPQPTRDGPGRPTPEVEARAELLKAVRNARAEELELDRGVLISNARLLAIAWEAPRTMDELRALGELKDWQLEALGDALMRVLGESA